MKSSSYGGWIGFGGEVTSTTTATTTTSSSNIVTIRPKDAIRRKIFIANIDSNAGLKIESSAGAIDSVTFDESNDGSSVTVRLVQSPSSSSSSSTTAAKATSAVIWLSQPSKGVNVVGSYAVSNAGAERVRGGWRVQIPEGGGGVDVVVRRG